MTHDWVDGECGPPKEYVPHSAYGKLYMEPLVCAKTAMK